MTLLEKKIEEMKKAHSMDKDKARQKLDDLEEKLRLRDLKIKVLEKKVKGYVKTRYSSLNFSKAPHQCQSSSPQ